MLCNSRTYTRGIAIAMLAVLLLGRISTADPAAAHEAPPNTRLEVTINGVYGSSLFDTDRSPEFRVTFGIGWSGHGRTCNWDRRTLRGEPPFELARHVMDFRHYTEPDASYTVELHSEHNLCVGTWGVEFDWPDPDDALPFLASEHAASGGWDAGENRMDGSGPDGSYIVAYTIRVFDSPEASVVVIAPGGHIEAPAPDFLFPDLAVTDIEVHRREDGTGRCSGGERNYITVTIRNHGDGPAGRFVVRVQAEGAAQEDSVDGLDAGDETTVRVRMRLEHGMRNVQAIVDLANDVWESNETNNTGSTTVACS